MAFDAFLKLEGIKGESKDKAYPAPAIHIESFSFGMSQQGTFGTATGGGAGKVNVHDLSVTKYVDNSSAELALHCANGKHIKSGLLVLRKAGEKPVDYMKIKLENILVSSVQHSGHSGGDVPMESLSLNFSKFWMEYQKQKPDGTAEKGSEMGWDVAANAKL
jgi:type VI secretion system secreted protein Hcp